MRVAQIFELCQIVLNYVQHIFQEGEKFCRGAKSPLVTDLSRSGQLIWLGSNFEKVAYGLKQVSVQVSLLKTRVYCDDLEDISYLKTFLNAFAVH